VRHQPINAGHANPRDVLEIDGLMVQVNRAMLPALHTGRMKGAGTVAAEHISPDKFDNVRMGRDVAREARGILGANGITLDYRVMRHMNNLESVYTYEGTNEIHTLISGQALTGISAFE
jgi:glutaryl-CoA dehydrogenase